MTTHLILGASGFLGEALMARVGRPGDRLVGTGRDHLSGPLRPLELRDPAAVLALLKDVNPDLVYLTAAYRDPDFCEDYPEETRRLNVEPVRLLVGQLPARAQLVFFSTDYVFEGQNPPYREESPCHPVNEYGRSKMEAEQAALARPDSLVVRIPVLVGAEPAYRGASGFIHQMARDLAAGQPTDVDYVLVRVPTWTHDIAAAVRFLCDRKAAGIFHVSSARGKTRYGWTVELAGLLNLPHEHLRPSRQIIARKATRPVNAQLATDKLRALGFDQFTDFRDVMRVVLDGCR